MRSLRDAARPDTDVRTSGFWAKRTRVRVAAAASGLALGALAMPFVAAAPAAAAPTHFTQCPAIGADTSGCGFLITLDSTGSATIAADTSEGPYDGSDDTLVGIVNNSGVVVNSVTLSSSNQDIFGFDGDGICTSKYTPWTGSANCPPSTTATGNGYAGPNTSYSGITNANKTGVVNFTGGLAPGASAFFSLENALNLATFTIPAKFTNVKSASPTSVNAGSSSPVTYNIAAHNPGNVVGSETVTDPVPMGLTLVTGSVSCPVNTTMTCAVTSSSPPTWTLTNVPAGATYNLTFQVTANANDPTETIMNTATWTGGGCTSSPCTTTTPVTVTNNAGLNFSGGKTVSATTAVAGSPTPITYMITGTNSSTVSTTTTGATVTDTIPAGSTLVGNPTCSNCTGTPSVSSAVITWTIPAGIVGGGTVVLGFQVTANASDTDGFKITNTANWSGSGCTPVAPATTCPTNTVTTTVSNNAGLNFSGGKTVDTGSAVAGSSTPISYTITGTNSSTTSTTTTGATVTDTIPAGSTLVGNPTCSNCTGTPSVSGGVITWTIPAGILGGGNVVLGFKVTANASDTDGFKITNTANWSGSGCTPVAPATTCPTNTVTTTVSNNAGLNFGGGKTVDTGSAVAGSSTPISYTITGTNSSTVSTTTTGATVTDTIPTGSTLVGNPTCSNCTGTPSVSGGVITWTIPAGILGGGNVVLGFKVTANANDTDGFKITNTANWSGSGCTPAAPATTCPTNTVTTTVSNNAGLNFGGGKTVSATTAVAGSPTPITYMITGTNSSTVSTTTTGATVTDTIPAGSTLVGNPTCSNCTGTPSVSGGVITWTIPAGILGGGTVVLGFQVTANANDTDGFKITNTANWSGSGCTPAAPATTCPTNTVTTTVSNNAGLNFGNGKAVDTSSAVAGSSSPISYTITGTNSSVTSTTTTGATVTDTIPAGSTLVGNPTCSNCTGTPSVSGGVITWTIPAGITAGGTVVLGFKVTANANDADGFKITNTANWSGAGCASSPCTTNQVTTTVTNNASFTQVKTASPSGAVSGGTTITYTIAATNHGVSTSAAPYVLTDIVPAQTTLSGTPGCPAGQTATSTPSCTFTQSGNRLTWSVNGVAGGATEAITFQVTVNNGATGSISNTATWTGPGCTPVAPATACSTNTTNNVVLSLSGRAFGLSATAKVSVLGVLSTNINIPAQPDTGSIVTTTAETVAPPCVATISGLINAGVICAKVTTAITPPSSTATATTATVNVGLPGVAAIGLKAVSATSTTSCSGSNGSTTIAFLQVGGQTLISTPTTFTAQTTLSVNAAGISVIVDEQVPITGTDHGLTVNAVHIKINLAGLRVVTADVIVSSATSDISGC